MILCENIAERFRDNHVPNTVQSYYLLCELIAGGSVELFGSTYGWNYMDLKSAKEGKHMLDLGNLTEFEISAAEYFNASLS